ncbi:MAG: hydrolase [Betaproteobacteria bacterium]
MLIDRARSQLLLVDMQQRMLAAIPDAAVVLAGCVGLASAAQRIGVPVAALEQYPKGLGALVPELRALLPDEAIGVKTRFSAVAAGVLPALPGSDRPQIVIAGVETHVCVLQTALDLHHEGKDVFVVADCVGSRRAEDRDRALSRLRDEGVRIVTREMVIFEWLGDAATPLFSDISKALLK